MIFLLLSKTNYQFDFCTNKILEQLLTLLKAKSGTAANEELEMKLESLTRRIKVLEDERNEAIVLAKELREVVDKWEN